MLLLATTILLVLNLAMDWGQKWLTVARPIVVLMSTAYTFRQLRIISDPRSSKDV